ncbi:hypothetical protein FUAX_34700 [Fulvitalea axinellae]|uniref:Cyclic nucleotide-binding domain-containing protein n=1 Tax=Fulvitalea axinellae TaxID=1182444 RepID=A0AAU9CLG5_9BACT|nr:hypothetical protein FUAX_34700 [Fulvitalea axinellae]
MIDILNFGKKKYSKSELELFSFLAKNPIFKDLTYREMALFAPHMYLRDYSENEVVFFRNDPSNAFYLLKTGNVRLSIDVSQGFESLFDVAPGMMFGENALLDNSKRLYHAIVTSEKARIYALPTVTLHDILSSNVEVKAKILHSFGELYDEYAQNLFKAYKRSFGFFDLSQVFGPK